MKRQKCRQCGARVIKFPLWIGQENNEPFSFDKAIWINFFKIDLNTLIFLIIVIILIFSYNADIERFEDIKDHPCNFCINAPEVCNWSNQDNLLNQDDYSFEVKPIT